MMFKKTRAQQEKAEELVLHPRNVPRSEQVLVPQTTVTPPGIQETPETHEAEPVGMGFNMGAQ
jgi:hypothetical protein